MRSHYDCLPSLIQPLVPVRIQHLYVVHPQHTSTVNSLSRSESAQASLRHVNIQNSGTGEPTGTDKVQTDLMHHKVAYLDPVLQAPLATHGFTYLGDLQSSSSFKFVQPLFGPPCTLAILIERWIMFCLPRDLIHHDNFDAGLMMTFSFRTINSHASPLSTMQQ